LTHILFTRKIFRWQKLFARKLLPGRLILWYKPLLRPPGKNLPNLCTEKEEHITRETHNLLEKNFVLNLMQTASIIISSSSS